ncbi:YegP family protein [Apibacter mensalis]|uniref:YegP family protein n=1 Tax=Apibacter mensalis TaxID=1586267 RepID=UPI0026EEB1C2|nr:YegP family protein [Apibacter mensalis]
MKHSNNIEKFYFEIYKDEDDVSSSNDRFYFKLKDEDGNSYIRSRPHIHKTNCLKELKSVLRNSKNRERFIIEQPFDNTWRVYLKAGNGEKIANSPCFGTEKDAKNFIKDLKSLSLETLVIDKTE